MLGYKMRLVHVHVYYLLSQSLRRTEHRVNIHPNIKYFLLQ